MNNRHLSLLKALMLNKAQENYLKLRDQLSKKNDPVSIIREAFTGLESQLKL